MNEIVATDFNRWYECRTPNENAVGMIHSAIEAGAAKDGLAWKKQ